MVSQLHGTPKTLPPLYFLGKPCESVMPLSFQSSFTRFNYVFWGRLFLLQCVCPGFQTYLIKQLNNKLPLHKDTYNYEDTTLQKILFPEGYYFK